MVEAASTAVSRQLGIGALFWPRSHFRLSSTSRANMASMEDGVATWGISTLRCVIGEACVMSCYHR